MIKKTVKYTDYEGIEREEDLYFHLTKTEVMEMESSVEGGLSAKLTNVVKLKSAGEIMKFCKELILKSYGVKMADGRGFRKSKELSDDFACSIAFDQIFSEMVTNEQFAADFIKGVLPAELVKQVEGSAIPPQLEKK